MTCVCDLAKGTNTAGCASSAGLQGKHCSASYSCSVLNLQPFPLLQELMADPVMVATGHTYDRVCIERWLAQGNRTCPVTGMRLRHLELTPNFALRNAIQVPLLPALGVADYLTLHHLTIPKSMLMGA